MEINVDQATSKYTRKITWMKQIDPCEDHGILHLQFCEREVAVLIARDL